MNETKMILPEKVAELTPVQKGWLSLSQKKTDCFDGLAKSELAIQGFFIGYETLELAPLQEALKKGKDEAGIAKDRRMQFTKMLDEKLIQPSMEFERRNQTLIDKVAAQELKLRQAAVKKNEEAGNKAGELQRLIAHIKNEYARLGTEYRNTLARIIAAEYADALAKKVAAANIPQLIMSIQVKLAEVKLGGFNKFTRSLVTDEEAAAAAKEIPKYEKIPDYEAAVEKLKKETFAMYEQDLQNAESAIAASTQRVEAEISSAAEELDLETATNVLMASATPMVMTGGPTIKKVRKIILEDNEQFAMNVLATFIKNWPEASKKIGVKSWTKLVDPFTKALEKLDTEFPNFKYDEKCK